MKFLIKKGTESFTKLQDLQKEINRCHEATAQFVKTFGSTKWLATNNLAGGFRGIVLDAKPADWKQVYDDCYFPKRIKKNSEILDKISQLPVVKNSALNSIINYNGFQVTPSMRVCYHPGFKITDEYCLISFPEDIDYEATDDMEELTVSEFKRLWGKDKD